MTCVAGWTLEVRRFTTLGKEWEEPSCKLEHVGYMQKAFCTKGEAAAYYDRLNPHMPAEPALAEHLEVGHRRGRSVLRGEVRKEGGAVDLLKVRRPGLQRRVVLLHLVESAQLLGLGRSVRARAPRVPAPERLKAAGRLQSPFAHSYSDKTDFVG